MTEASSIDGTENLYAVQLSDDRRLTPQQLADYVAESYVYDKTNSDTTTIAGKLNELEAALTSATNLLPRIYPIGAIYWSSRDTSPASLFGGTWTQIQNRFLIGAGGSYAVNATGGEATHTLTVAEMPSHNHGGKTGGPSNNTSGAPSEAKTGESANHTHAIPALSGTALSDGAHTHTYPRGSGGTATTNTTFLYSFWGLHTGTATMSTNGKHTHTVTTNAATSGNPDKGHTHSLQSHTHDLGNHTHTITGQGSSGAHNNMPPYVVYYCWERTA